MKITLGQFGGQRGMGTEHLIVCLVERVLKLLDSNQERSAAIATCVDWSAAFFMQDPTMAITKRSQYWCQAINYPRVSKLKEWKMKVNLMDRNSNNTE